MEIQRPRRKAGRAYLALTSKGHRSFLPEDSKKVYITTFGGGLAWFCDGKIAIDIVTPELQPGR